jgi:maltose O-acetyltransferase
MMEEKTEKEKMMAGELYLASDPELASDRLRARRLTVDYNATFEGEANRRSRILQELFGSLGPGAEIEPPFYCDYGHNIYAGSRLYMNFGCVVLDCNRVDIGDDAQFGPYVQIYAATHPIDPAVRKSKRELSAPVRIGNNVWIGGGAIILPGITIGDNTTIGAGSVVADDIPANVVAAGNPCTVKKQL